MFHRAAFGHDVGSKLAELNARTYGMSTSGKARLCNVLFITNTCHVLV